MKVKGRRGLVMECKDNMDIKEKVRFWALPLLFHAVPQTSLGSAPISASHKGATEPDVIPPTPFPITPPGPVLLMTLEGGGG